MMAKVCLALCALMLACAVGILVLDPESTPPHAQVCVRDIVFEYCE